MAAYVKALLGDGQSKLDNADVNYQTLVLVMMGVVTLGEAYVG